MENENDNLTIALLIDTENVSAQYLKKVNDFLITLGKVTYKRMYGDFTKQSEKGWNSLVNKYALSTVQQFSFTKQKNVSDSKIVIDAMDILYSGNVNAFCIMSSDSDFTGLVKRLKESNMYVIGAGEGKTPPSFVNACDRFLVLDENKKIKKTKTKAKEVEVDNESEESIEEVQTWSVEELLNFTTSVLESSGMERYPLASLMAKIYQAHPQFDVKNYNVRKAMDLFPKDRFNIEPGNGPEVYISLK